ncbi:P-loop containing nucleoside triphosphate hydrolase protein, partial [Dunaliella salina]
MQVHMVQWYPGHIAKAERQLKEQLKMVDVVLEGHTRILRFCQSLPQLPGDRKKHGFLYAHTSTHLRKAADRRAWDAHFKAIKQGVIWTDGQRGAGAPGLKSRLLKVSKSINEKRAKRGLQPRPVRACVIGFPNIGKSALINRLINRRAVASAPKVGVTRLLQRGFNGCDSLHSDVEVDLLDAPGVIPASFNDRIAAQRLAICNDIGEASYIDSLVAAALVIRCKLLPTAPQLLKV